jgi:hypothetical protein
MKKTAYIILLSFLVSCNIKSDKISMINTLITLEQQIQKMNVIQVDIGNSYKMNIYYELLSTPKNKQYSLKRSKLNSLYNRVLEIDNETSKTIQLLDNYKSDLLKISKDLDPSMIVWNKQNNSILPSQLNLEAVKNKSNTKNIDAFFLNKNGNPNTNGLKLWEALLSYRRKVVEISGTYSLNEKQFTLYPKDINMYKNLKDLREQVNKMLNENRINTLDDESILIDLYTTLTKKKIISSEGKKVHWITSSFKNTSLISAIAVLTSLQQDILNARSMAIAHYSNKINNCGYGFDSILPVVINSGTIYTGEKASITVFMAALDSENQPTVEVKNSDITITYSGNGTGIVSFIPKKGINTIEGTISIKNKSGVLKKEPWKYTINAIEK